MLLFNYLFFVLHHILISITTITVLVLICYNDIIWILLWVKTYYYIIKNRESFS